MPPLAIAVGALAIGVGIAGVGMLENASAAKKSAKALQAQTALQRQQAQLQGMRQRMDAVRTGRQALAQVRQSAENQGVSASSAAQGGQASIVSQMMGNVSFLDSYNHMTDLAEGFADKAAHYQAKANMWGAVENFGFTLAKAGASFL
jgi:F0F1-type ATP synthase membrane subunit b/b'